MTCVLLHNRWDKHGCDGNHIVDTTIVILALTGCILLSTLLLFSRSRRKQLRDHWAGQEDPLERIAALKAQFPSPTDQKACDRIERELRGVSRTFALKTSIAPKRVYAMATDLTRDIAEIYYPDTDTPVLQASIADLLKLDERIVSRLTHKIEEFPLNAIKDVSIHKILAGKEFYDSKVKNKLDWIKKYKAVYTLGNRAWLAYNALSPWYWGRKLAYTSAREITFRYLLTWIITIVGEEAMAVYSRRDINTHEAVFERDLAFAIVEMAAVNQAISGKTYAAVLNHVLNKARINDTVRVNVLRALVNQKLTEKYSPQGTYTKKQAQKMLASLKRVAAADGGPNPGMAAWFDSFEEAMEDLPEKPMAMEPLKGV